MNTEELWLLPTGWEWASFGEVATVASDLIDPKLSPNSPHIAPNHIESKTGRLLPYATIAEDKVMSPKHRFRRGQILYSKIRPYLCKAVLVDFEGLCSADMYPITTTLESSYLLRWMLSPTFTEMASGHDTRTLLPKINQEALALLQVPIPPLAEQRRIVAAVERILGAVTAARARLDRVPATLKRFRQAVLAAACSGRLTEDWRERNGFGEVEECWASHPANRVCELVQSGTTPRDRTVLDSGVPFLKVYNIVDQKVAFAQKPQFISEATHRGDSRRGIAKPGDVIMNIVGPPLGKVAVIPNDFPEWNVNQAITIFRPGASINRDFLFYLLCSGIPYEDILMETRGSAGQTNISLSQCRDMEFQVPPLAEQQEIVRRVSALFARADAIEAALTAARKRVDALTQSVLAKAFRGELVPTEAELARRENRSYESATDLLTRLRASTPTPPAKPTRARKSMQ